MDVGVEFHVGNGEWKSKKRVITMNSCYFRAGRRENERDRSFNDHLFGREGRGGWYYQFERKSVCFSTYSHFPRIATFLKLTFLRTLFADRQISLRFICLNLSILYIISLHSKNISLIIQQVNHVLSWSNPSRGIILDGNLSLINHRENSNLILFGEVNQMKSKESVQVHDL